LDDQECLGPFRAKTSIVLASGSPRRRELLAALGLDFTIQAALVEEIGPESGLSPREMVLQNAEAKAREVYSKRGGAVVIGADTCVALAGRIYGKPEGMEDAVRMLSELSDRWHQVFTGTCVMGPAPEHAVLFVVESRVYLSGFGMPAIRAYCRTGEPLDKAGAYAVQGVGSFMVREIRGSWTNVVGLPMTELSKTLLEAGVIEPCVNN